MNSRSRRFSKIIDDAQAGLTCPSENPKMLARNIEQLYLMKKKDLDKLGKNALDHYNKEFERTMLMDRVEAMFLNMTIQ